MDSNSKVNHAPKLTDPSGEEPELVAVAVAVAEYPQRPLEPDCSHYLKFGRCGYGMKCMFNHPPKPSGGQWRWLGEKQQSQETTVEYPQRPAEPDCSHYLKFGRCGLGTKCMFNHPPKTSGGQWRQCSEKQHGQEETVEYPQRPREPDCCYYLKFGRCGHGMKCMFNHPPASRSQPRLPAGACRCNHEERRPELNSLGLPLRPGTGLCSYYMHKGICKFGTSCKFHHPDRLESEQGNPDDANLQWSSPQHNSYSRLQAVVTPELDPSRPLGPPPLHLPTPFLLRQPSKGKDISTAQQSGHQLGDSSFEPAKRIRYTTDELLQLRDQAQQIVDVTKLTVELKQHIDMELHDEDHSWAHNDSNNVHSRSYSRYDLADSREWHPRSEKTPKVASEEEYCDKKSKELYGSSGKQEEFCEHDHKCCSKFDSKAQATVDCEKFRLAAIENEHLPNMTYEDMLDSSSIAPETNLAVINTTIESKQGSCDTSIIGKTNKDVFRKSEEEMLRKSFTEEPNSTEHEESNHLVEFDVSSSNSMASMGIDQVGCSISEIIKLICRCWSQERHV
ncbi:hypothetical protein BS78_06G044900 [Paspalum vaginatum]|nr:hypothetical protein BS78_06G044900 [Paspalum vaginatum]